MRYIIGIDGGGTKTDIVIADENLNIVAKDKGGPCNFILEGKDKTVNLLTDLIKSIIKDSNLSTGEIRAVCAGIAGAGRKNDRQLLQKDLSESLSKQGLNFEKILIETDGRVTLEGAHSGKEGCILIAGTGSILFGKTSSGKFFRSGGFGRIIGDQGSAFMIGRKAFIFLAESFDKRSAENLLTNMMIETFNLNNEDELIESVYKNKIDIASAAPLVLKAAALGDESSIQILEEETEELLKHISAALLRFENNEFNLSLGGGLLNNENIYSELLKEKAANNYPLVKFKKPDHPPVIGAVLLLKNS